jgi:hypothetical protein
MKVRHLREWINSLPQEKDEHDLVFRKIKPIEDSENLIAEDHPISASGIDDETNEAFFCSEESYMLMVSDGEEINN